MSLPAKPSSLGGTFEKKVWAAGGLHARVHGFRLFSVGLAALLALSGCAVRTTLRPGFYAPRVPTAAESQRISFVRVLLADKQSRLSVGCAGTVTILDPRRKLPPQQVRLADDAQIIVQGAGLLIDRRYVDADSVEIAPMSGDALRVNGFRYRGEIQISQAGGKLRAINRVPLEDYLQGVVANEMEPSWPAEALKAQAVAARTYTLGRLLNPNPGPYDLEAGTNSQVYRGLDSERPATTQAVAETRGIIALYRDKLISAFYHSNCGGRTADVRDVWGGGAPYLEGVACGFCDDGPHAAWKAEIRYDELETILRRHNLDAPGLDSVKVRDRTPDQRAARVEIGYRGGAEELKGAAFRMMVGPDRIKSTRFEVAQRGRSAAFSGQGWGHGVGLCQEGARGMARSGYRFEEILGHYYPGIELRRLAP